MSRSGPFSAVVARAAVRRRKSEPARGKRQRRSDPQPIGHLHGSGREMRLGGQKVLAFARRRHLRDVHGRCRAIDPAGRQHRHAQQQRQHRQEVEQAATHGGILPDTIGFHSALGAAVGRGAEIVATVCADASSPRCPSVPDEQRDNGTCNQKKHHGESDRHTEAVCNLVGDAEAVVGAEDDERPSRPPVWTAFEHEPPHPGQERRPDCGSETWEKQECARFIAHASTGRPDGRGLTAMSRRRTQRHHRHAQQQRQHGQEVEQSASHAGAAAAKE